MTTVFVHDKGRMLSKPRPQIEQEMGIILAHGGRYFAWDNPTRQSGLVLERQEMLGKIVAPFLRARQAWCLDSRAMPDVALFHGATAHYAANTVTPAAFPRQNPALLATCEGLRRLHLSPEMVSDHRLEIGAIRSRLLIFEDSPQLSVANQNALRRFVQEGGRVLLTGRAVDATGPRVPHHGAAAGTPGAGGAPAARHSVRQLDLEPRPLAGACARV